MFKSGRAARGALKAPAPAARSPPSSGAAAGTPLLSPPLPLAAATVAAGPPEAAGMELRAAAALCLCCLWSACRLRHGQLDADAARPLPAAPVADGGGGEEEEEDEDEEGHGLPLLGPDGAFRNDTVVPHGYMVALYHRLARGRGRGHRQQQPPDGSGGRADTVRGFVDQAQPADDLPAEDGQRYLFDLSGLPAQEEEVVGAELRIPRAAHGNRSQASPCRPDGRLLLSTCAAGGELRLLDSRPCVLSAGALWETFDVRGALEAGQATCFLLRLVSASSGQPLPAGQLGFGSARPPAERALLVVSSRARRRGSFFQEMRHRARALRGLLLAPSESEASERRRQRRRRPRGRRRPRRGTPLGGRGSPGGRSQGGKKAKGARCGRKALHVDFKELGWDDWIIAPLDYEAYHCEGACDFPLRSHLEPTNHAIIQTLMNSMDPESSPPSCCVPSKLSPISILYIDAANNVVYKQYEDMVVESCGCR